MYFRGGYEHPMTSIHTIMGVISILILIKIALTPGYNRPRSLTSDNLVVNVEPHSQVLRRLRSEIVAV